MAIAFGSSAGFLTSMGYQTNALGWGLEAIKERVYHLAGRLRQQLSEIDGVQVTDEGREKCGIVTFISEQMEPTAIKEAMAAHKINVWTSSSAGSPVSFQARGLTNVVRASLHYFNTEQEVDYFIDILRKTLKLSR